MLKLDELFKLFEEVEKSGILSEESPFPVSVTQQQKVIKLPRLHISEDWGTESADRTALTNTLKMALGGSLSGDPFETLNNLEKKIVDLQQKVVSNVGVDNPAEALSQMVVLDTLNRLFNSFQSSPTGFINEAFVSALYGGQQVKLNTEKDDEESGVFANQIGDVLTKDGVPVSVKTLIENGVVKGSWNNLVESLNKSPTKEIYFDIFTKKYSGDGKDKKVIGLDAYRFVINEDNIEKLSGGVVEKVGNQFVFAESLNEDIPFAWGPKLTRMKEVIDELRTNGWKLEPNIKRYFAETSLVGRGRKTLEQRYKTIFDTGQQYLEDDNEKQKFQKVINQAHEQHKEKIMMGKEVTLGGGGEGKTQFSLSAPAWKALVKQQGGKVAHIEISNERVDQLVKKSLTILGSSIVDLFSDLEKFSELVNSYLSTNDPNRSEVGSKAIQYAKKIKPSTEKVVGEK